MSMSRHDPPPKSLAPPPPLPPGYHKKQKCGPSGVDPSPSRPLSPMEQFDLTEEYQVWEQQVAGEPTKEDLEVGISQYLSMVGLGNVFQWTNICWRWL